MDLVGALNHAVCFLGIMYLILFKMKNPLSPLSHTMQILFCNCINQSKLKFFIFFYFMTTLVLIGLRNTIAWLAMQLHPCVKVPLWGNSQVYSNLIGYLTSITAITVKKNYVFSGEFFYWFSEKLMILNPTPILCCSVHNTTILNRIYKIS